LHSVASNGRLEKIYTYSGYKYIRLDDALNYARLQEGKSEMDNISEQEKSAIVLTEINKMNRYGISSEDKKIYTYRGYRYSRLDDAVNYARLQEGKSEIDNVSEQGKSATVLTEISKMDRYGISSEDKKVYTYGGYRYSRLDAAVNYARLQEGKS
jgi:hypothetical protein